MEQLVINDFLERKPIVQKIKKILKDFEKKQEQTFL